MSHAVASAETIGETTYGLAGPRSVTWQLHADPSMWLGGIASLYLQALHPRTVAGVVQNSDYRTNPLGRLVSTAEFVTVGVYGRRDKIEAAAARVRRVHASLRATDPDTGRTFRVDEPDLLLWVHCAEVHSFLDVARRAGYPLTDAQADRYLDEQRATAALVGLDPAAVPGSVTAMDAYLASTRPALRHTDDSQGIYDYLHRPPVTGRLRLGLPVYEPVIGHLAYSLLPAWARRLYGHRAYPDAVATAMLRTLRTAALATRGVNPFLGPHPSVRQAIRDLGEWARPSPANLPEA
ncbi:uncharacterized protein (DUF2236 family) [Herbihabitans rhizosphaerae]|uniref:Uncharacterized protein (DUF2236 family) n=1 Tax=Herbihabitans rhizosphaerae TaxID=1872711 RepID=A0A4Q7KPV3_9PSEU|nr:oxygenase MpaB family protein [Herbihabitans rhizosphaerae]RZS38819.1 uncharacterized protein (DUF2236 family) [Herbihabitans rhizosphaerae]